jgi:uncharacterized protein (DUF58 family)
MTRWRRTVVPAAGTLLGIIVCAASVLYGRADVAVVGVCLFVAVAVARRPGSTAGVQVALAHDGAAREVSGTTPVTVLIEVRAPHDVDAALLRVTTLGFEVQEFTVRPPARLTARVPLAHSGEQEVLAVEHRPVAGGGAFIADAGQQRSLHLVVEPELTPVRFLPVPRRLRGLTGAHQSARPGDGGEFRDIHPFATGDRLRRVDWKATARLARRPGDLYVRRTNATSDVDVAIVFDDSDDVGEAVSEWTLGDPTLTGTTSMDVARNAAWSLASAYLAAGDSVSFQVLSRAGGAVPRGAGGRQRERLRAAIAATSPHPRFLTRARTPLVAPGAMIVLLSTYLDGDAVRLASLWRAAGHRVLAVDTLPTVDAGALNRRQLLALRVVLGRREERLHELRAVGADVIAWHGPPARLAADLRSLSLPRRS